MHTASADSAIRTRFPHVGTRRIAVTGATGFVGRALVAMLAEAGHVVLRLTRRPAAAEPGAAEPGARVADVGWDPSRGTLDPRALDGVDAVIHLAGEPISERWTDARKRAILESRVLGTRLLATTLATMERKPRVLVSTSAIGYYGDGGDTVLTEESPAGRDFLATVAREWEAAAQPAAAAGIRVVHPRLGIVLAPDGGALARLLLPFRLGGGGRLGSGEQWMSWIALSDTVSAYEHLAFTDAARGPVNVAAPNPVRNAEFTDTLAKVLGRPALVHVPAFALRLLFGEMGEVALLAGQRAAATKLERLGFVFRHPTLEGALRHELARA